MMAILHVTAVRVLRPYVLEVTFDNGVCKRVDLSSYLDKGVFQRLRDPDVFARAEVSGCTVAWLGVLADLGERYVPDLDLAPEALYELPEVEP
jgi:hypothetical protein